MWYQTACRRHLCDMHIEDWDEQFLSRFSPEKYVQDLVTAKVQNPMIYLQSHRNAEAFQRKSRPGD